MAKTIGKIFEQQALFAGQVQQEGKHLKLDADELERFLDKSRGRERHSGPVNRGRPRPRSLTR